MGMVGMVAGVNMSYTYHNSMVVLPVFVTPTSGILENECVGVCSCN